MQRFPTSMGLLLVLAAALGGPVRAADSATDSTLSAPSAHGWKARETDNICGIKQLRRVSNPALVSYDALLAVTPEMRRIKREGIDPDSTKGKALRQEARERVAKAAEAVRSEQGFCSVWKSIRHKDGREIPDVTGAVRAHLEQV